MMTPNSNKDNKDGNSKNNGKAMMTPKTTTEGGEHCQLSGDKRGGGHDRRPRDTAIAPTRRDTLLLDPVVSQQRCQFSTVMGTNKKSGQNL